MKKIEAVYRVKPEYLSELCTELGGEIQQVGALVLSAHRNLKVCFAQDIWLEPQVTHFQSIAQAVKILQSSGKFWYMEPVSHIRRATLIAEQLRKTPSLVREFPLQDALPVVGGFALLDQNTMIYSPQRAKAWPQGRCCFIEDKINPPNRAYLKLWEALSYLPKLPQPNDRVLDLGASPGGWTWVMQSLGTEVTAVDKAALAPNIAQLPRVHYLQQSAFAIEPSRLEHSYDWVLSDVACYPERAYGLILKWLESGRAKQLIFTIKLQGNTNLEIIKKFQQIPNSCIINLFYNKHEATFFYPAPVFS